MSKYNTSFKREVVERYLQGDAGQDSIADRFGIDHGTLRTWVAAYQAHGEAGLAKKFSHYSAEFKFSVLQRMEKDALSMRETAAIFNIRNKSALAVWQKSYETGGLAALAPRRKGRRKKMPDPVVPPNAVAMPPDAGKTQVKHAEVASKVDTRTREELLAALAYLEMENEYLKKLRALIQKEQAPITRKSFKS
jgi:transposase